jgi:hypothetical protein
MTRKIIAFPIIGFWLYAAFAFISQEFNPNAWTSEGRAFFVVWWGVFYCIHIPFWRLLNDTKN